MLTYWSQSCAAAGAEIDRPNASTNAVMRMASLSNFRVLEVLEVGDRLAVVPVPDRPVRRPQKPEQAAVGAVPEPMAARLDGVARLDVGLGDARPLELRPTGGFERPQLRLALRVLDLDVDPGMGQDEVHFLDDARNVFEGLFVLTVRMVRR